MLYLSMTKQERIDNGEKTDSSISGAVKTFAQQSKASTKQKVNLLNRRKYFQKK